MESPFDHILRKQIYQHQTRLPFAELCGFYAALMDGISPAVSRRGRSGMALYHDWKPPAPPGTSTLARPLPPRRRRMERALGRDAASFKNTQPN